MLHRKGGGSGTKTCVCLMRHGAVPAEDISMASLVCNPRSIICVSTSVESKRRIFRGLGQRSGLLLNFGTLLARYKREVKVCVCIYLVEGGETRRRSDVGERLALFLRMQLFVWRQNRAVCTNAADEFGRTFSRVSPLF